MGNSTAEQTPDFEMFLDICIDQLHNGSEVDTSVQPYPKHAEELASLLAVAAELYALPSITLSAAGVTNGNQRMLTRAAELRHERTLASVPPMRRRHFWPLLRVAATLAMILALLPALTGGVLAATNDTLPNSWLYPAKRAAEDLVIGLAPTPGLQVAAHTFSAERRLHEIELLITREGNVDSNLIIALERETLLALTIAERDDVPALNTVAAAIDHQQAVLTRLLADAPEPTRPALERALANVDAERIRVR
ncbi:MAG TPA: DUF5667 domain-containing protein, partial [Roseiflexaceae bacterium]|nr:DUF5667 domain-containing protein [Roseiflexaceae bacterium]